MASTRARSASLHDMHTTTKALQDLNKKVVNIRKSIKVLGTFKDSYAFRDKQPDVNGKHLQIMERSYTTVATELKKATTEYKSTARRFEPTGTPSAAPKPYMDVEQGASSSGGGGFQQHSQVQHEGEVVLEMKGFGDVDMAILEERNQDAHAILQESKQLNETMQDLAGLVQEQSEQIQAIDKEVQHTGERVERGNAHLEEASDLQKAARRKNCCILGIVVVVLIAICIPIILTQSKSS